MYMQERKNKEEYDQARFSVGIMEDAAWKWHKKYLESIEKYKKLERKSSILKMKYESDLRIESAILGELLKTGELSFDRHKELHERFNEDD